MIKVYRLDKKGGRHLTTTYLDDQFSEALAYARSRACRTKEDHVIVRQDGMEKFIFGDFSRIPF